MARHRMMMMWWRESQVEWVFVWFSRNFVHGAHHCGGGTVWPVSERRTTGFVGESWWWGAASPSQRAGAVLPGLESSSRASRTVSSSALLGAQRAASSSKLLPQRLRSWASTSLHLPGDDPGYSGRSKRSTMFKVTLMLNWEDFWSFTRCWVDSLPAALLSTFAHARDDSGQRWRKGDTKQRRVNSSSQLFQW